MAKSKPLHKEVVERSYKGRVVRFRPVEDVVYVAVVDIRNLLMMSYSEYPVYALCPSASRIEFYRDGTPLSAILPFDLENLAKAGKRKTLSKDEIEKIAWIRETCKQLLEDEPNVESALQIFSNKDFGDVRVNYTDNELLFCLPDVCKAIGIANSRNVKNRLDAEDVYQMDTQTTGGVQKTTFITESGLYETLLRSDSEKAKPFRKWITKEVIPSIRRTGGYVAATPDDTPEVVMARGLMAAKEALDRAEERAIVAEKRLLLIEPKADYYDSVIENRELYTLHQLAGELGISYGQLRDKLYKENIITNKRGEISVFPEFNSWGELTSARSGRYRNTFRWNKLGRIKIFEIIAPNMPH